MIPTVLRPKKTNSLNFAFKKVIEYVGRDDDEARAKGQQPLTEESCGVFNMDADCGTPEDRELIWQIMGSDARAASRYKGNPVYHFDVSWMEGEHPTREQLEQTVRHFIDGLGFGKCQTFWAVHRDTDHDHLHIVVNKVIVYPENGTYIIVEKPRFDYRELARLAREVELEQGWEHAPGYYVVVEPSPGEKKIMTMKEAASRKLWNEDWLQQKKISRNAGRAEHNLAGAESFQSWVMMEPAQALHEVIIKPGATWAQAHAVLAQLGISIETKGSGMVVTAMLDDGRVLAAKASQLGKWASKAALEKQLGPFVPRQENKNSEKIAQQVQQSLRKTYQQTVWQQRMGSQQQNDPVANREARKVGRAAARKALAERFERERAVRTKEERQQKRAALRERHQRERTTLKANLTEQRRQLFRDAKVHHRFVEPVQLALHARDRAMQLEALQARQVQERKALTESFPKYAATWREWLEQQADHGDEAAQAALRGIRYNEQRKKLKPDNAVEGEEEDQQQKAFTVARLKAEIDRRLQLVIYKSASGATCFVDEGSRIVVKDRQNDTLEAALRVAAAKYRNQVTITGTAQFREEAARMAARLGINVKDADLQKVAEDEKTKLKAQLQRRTTPLDRQRPER